jgi:hypothetical protein
VISSDMTCRRYRYSPNCWRNVASPGMDMREARFNDERNVCSMRRITRRSRHPRTATP